MRGLLSLLKLFSISLQINPVIKQVGSDLDVECKQSFPFIYLFVCLFIFLGPPFFFNKVTAQKLQKPRKFEIYFFFSILELLKEQLISLFVCLSDKFFCLTNWYF